MALLKRSELKSMNDQAMSEKLRELKKEMIKISMQRATGTTLANPGKPRQVKKAIAQIYTVIQQRKMMKAASQPTKQPQGGSEKK